ncbi:hypothetical protein [Bradyrhizobium cytisi]|uniref:Uncharacterized protein n=1 Tax=Bradyrhizobium cytisi TaxID=515489 RepID=A0A5S4X1X5_9BRAD|nr:hypothetical protein [Bradyrhizobium cytisi]TYL83548.1 hypothetical protein FXB38_17750 [Bradyrhizobium cytisi]
MAKRAFSNEIAAKPIHLDELGLDRLSPRFRITLSLPFLMPRFRCCSILCLGYRAIETLRGPESTFQSLVPRNAVEAQRVGMWINLLGTNVPIFRILLAPSGKTVVHRVLPVE